MMIIIPNCSVVRMFTNQFGLSGRTNLEMAQADEIVDVINDLVGKRTAAIKEVDEEKKSARVREVMFELIPQTLVIK